MLNIAISYYEAKHYTWRTTVDGKRRILTVWRYNVVFGHVTFYNCLLLMTVIYLWGSPAGGFNGPIMRGLIATCDSVSLEVREPRCLMLKTGHLHVTPPTAKPTCFIPYMTRATAPPIFHVWISQRSAQVAIFGTARTKTEYLAW